MHEVEIKVRNINKAEITKKIKELGAVKHFEGKIIDYRYDTPLRTLSSQGKALRIRQKGQHIYLNVKGKKENTDAITERDEYGVRVMNMGALRKILTELGYIKIFELEKHRTEYKLDDTHFDIDEYVGFPPLLEIESTNPQKVENMIKELDIKEKDIGRIYMRELLAARRKVKNKEKNKRKYHNNRNKKFPKL